MAERRTEPQEAPPRAVWKGKYRPQRETIMGADGEVEVEAGLIPVEYIPDVPARDLSREEYDALSPELKKQVRESDLYEVESPSSRS